MIHYTLKSSECNLHQELVSFQCAQNKVMIVLFTTLANTEECNLHQEFVIFKVHKTKL